ncbi:UNVERIFIED_CONTAM: FIP1[V]-like protein [Sesamum radiatum]|uniref:FIP1[V]-like protein n=1 Tax=Sesamum radiatum TaxID=300843 RepID=A0AAW2TT25_SESRA
MEVEEEEEVLGELCSEILKNWTSPIYSDLIDTSPHRNPFSHHYHHPQTPKYDHSADHIVLEQKQEKMMKALTTSYNERGSKHEHDDDQNQPVVPLLVADTFFDKVLGRCVDGVDITALSEAKEGNESFADLRTILHENDAVPTSVSTINNGKEVRDSGPKSSLRFKPNFPMANRIPKRFPISSEIRRTPATSTPAPSEIRSSSGCGFVGKFRFMLPRNKTIFDINIDRFGEKLWRNPGANMSDFFNYGLDEKQWKDYCKLMASDILQARVQVGRSKKRKVTADESIPSHKQWLIGEVKSGREVDERFKFPLPNLKNVAADKSMQRERNTILPQGTATTYSDIKYEGPIGRRKWTSRQL